MTLSKERPYLKTLIIQIPHRTANTLRTNTYGWTTNVYETIHRFISGQTLMRNINNLPVPSTRSRLLHPRKCRTTLGKTHCPTSNFLLSCQRYPLSYNWSPDLELRLCWHNPIHDNPFPSLLIINNMYANDNVWSMCLRPKLMYWHSDMERILRSDTLQEVLECGKV